MKTIEKLLKSKPTIEGAGVHLKRAFGYHEVKILDPFLLLDDFHSNNPKDYLAGFPWHPHRGIETVTYMIRGTVEHGDSIGNKGVINSGDVQWMTAGSGIIHQEMPKDFTGMMQGFQLWVNLPSSHKMMDPRYRGITANHIPEVKIDDGIRVKIIAGELNNIKGPVHDLVVDVEYLDVMIPPRMEFAHKIDEKYKTFAYVFEGSGFFSEKDKLIKKEHLVLFNNDDRLRIRTAENNLRFLLVSGIPIGEPVAWYGPIVMNTQKELEQAFEEYQNGTFIKNRRMQ
ncbi:pirin family protein [[Eubacterium] cellulosolvens]